MKRKLNDVKHGKTNFGIFLIFLQTIGLLGIAINGKNLPMDNIFRLIGFFLPGIIGFILIIIDNKNDD